MTEEINPYAAPESPVEARSSRPKRQYKASIWVRFLANLVDSFLYGLPTLAVYIATAVITDVELQENGYPELTPDGFVVLGATLATFAIVVGVQLVMLNANGWSMGKRLFKIRIVRKDGSRAGLARIFWLRMALPGVLNMIPCFGSVFSLVDALFILGNESRCLHDYMADTIVVKA